MSSRNGLPVIRYAGWVPTCRINSVSYLSPPLTPLPRRYTQDLPFKL